MHAAGRAARPGKPAKEKVASGPAKRLGEPAAAQDSAAAAVTATDFAPTGARATVWTRLAASTGWRYAGFVLPAGFGTSYDPAAAAVPGGPLLVVAGTAPPGAKCTTDGSVAIANVNSRGRLGTARLVSDQRGTGSFDDRPAVAIGSHGRVWVAWSQGPNSDACQDVGYGDQIEVAASRDGGRTFGAPVAIPAAGGHSAFGVRLAPLSGGRVAVSWTETMAAGYQAVLVSVLGANGQPGPAVQALTGQGPPLVLPGASFYDFPAGDLVALHDGRLVVAAPFWDSGRSVIKLAVGTPGGRWQSKKVRPPDGADLLLPALGLLRSGGLRLVCAVHSRTDDRLGYDWAALGVTGSGLKVKTGLTALTAAPPGPGFFEIGEELSLTSTPDGLITAMVVGGKTGALLEAASFRAPPPAASSSPDPSATATASRPASSAAAGTTPGGGGFTSDAGTPQSANGWWPVPVSTTVGVAAAGACCVVVLSALLTRRRR